MCNPCGYGRYPDAVDYWHGAESKQPAETNDYAPTYDADGRL
jgi:hypothetical protein